MSNQVPVHYDDVRSDEVEDTQHDDVRNSRNFRPQRKDPRDDTQVVIRGSVKNGREGELVVFTLKLLFFSLIFLVNVPKPGQRETIIYCKFRLNNKSGEEIS
jgi:hypothetical protein